MGYFNAPEFVRRLENLGDARPRFGKVWDERKLSRTETRLGLVFPEAFREFLRRVGDGGDGFLAHDCCEGALPLRGRGRKEMARLAQPFPFAAPVNRPGDVRSLPGSVYLGRTADHCDAVLVMNGRGSGQVWVDGARYGRPFAPIGSFGDLMEAWLSGVEAEQRVADAGVEQTLTLAPPGWSDQLAEGERKAG